MLRAFMVRDIDSDILERAHERAKSEGTSLSRVLREQIARYAEGRFASTLGRSGGLARAKKLTKEQRSAQAAQAVRARWAKGKKGD